jgi:hypothetical protein
MTPLCLPNVTKSPIFTDNLQVSGAQVFDGAVVPHHVEHVQGGKLTAWVGIANDHAFEASAPMVEPGAGSDVSYLNQVTDLH